MGRENFIMKPSELLEFGGEDDYVHPMVSCHPKLAISNLVGKLKGKSSYLLSLRLEPSQKYPWDQMGKSFNQ